MEITANRSIVTNTFGRTAPVSLETISADPNNAETSQVTALDLDDTSSIDLTMKKSLGSRSTVNNDYFSAAQNLGELDLRAEVDTAGSPMELVDKVTEQMEDLGRTALLTQTNQLPPVAMSLGE
jgi:hypothetical protein